VTGHLRDAARTFQIDSVAPPTPTITSKPANPTNSTSASLAFSDGEGSVAFLCQLDGGGFAACSSPKSYAGLGDGSHTFKVRATDQAGNTAAATANCTVPPLIIPPLRRQGPVVEFSSSV